MSKNFIERAKESGRVRPISEAFKEEIDEEDNFYKIEDIYYSVKETTVQREYKIGDIVFIENYQYKDMKEGHNHLFVVIDKDNIAIPLNYFCMIISSNIKKLQYQENILLEKDDKNNLRKDSIVKTDVIYQIDEDAVSYSIGKVPIEKVEFYKECFESNNLKKYIKKEKSLIDTEYELLERISKYRKKNNLSQRDLANIIGIKQPTLANIEKGKHSPQLNTLLTILNSLGYTVNFEKK